MDKYKRVNLVLTRADAEDLVTEIASLRDLIEVDDLEPEWPVLAETEKRVERILLSRGRIVREPTTTNGDTP